MAIPGSYWLLMQFIAFSMHQEHNHRKGQGFEFSVFVSSTVSKNRQKMPQFEWHFRSIFILLSVACLVTLLVR